MTGYFKALGDQNRLLLLSLLSNHSLCVCELEVILDLSQSNVSRHLAKLKQEGIIIGDKDAQWIHYHVNPDFIKNHEKLYHYLINEFSNKEEYKSLLKKCEVYVDSNLNCQDITHNRSYVEEFLVNGMSQ